MNMIRDFLESEDLVQDNGASQGFPALDYLLFGLEENDKDVATVGGLYLSHSEQLPTEGEKATSPY